MNYKNMALELIENRYDQAKKYKEELIKTLSRETAEGTLNLCIFGTGLVGKGFYRDLNALGIKTKCFCDNNSEKWGKTIFEGAVCLSLEELKEFCKTESVLVILGLGAVNEVYPQLRTMGIENIVKHPFDLLAEPQNKWMKVKKDKILDGVSKLFDALYDEESKRIAYYKVSAWFMTNSELLDLDYGEIYTSDEYVPEDIMSLQGKEFMVDCGAFTGDTLAYFIDEVGYNQFQRYTCFELSKFNFEKLEERVSAMEEYVRSRVRMINKGVADKCMEISYTGEISGTHIKEGGETAGETVTLDETLMDERVTYIKMDVEGCEISAIHGGENLIRKNKPKCAICVYHQATDLWEIPLLLNELVPDYKLYLRHHQTVQTDTVCYATI